MTDLSITANNVSPASSAIKETLIALEAITAGQVVYKDPTTGKAGLADNNSATAAVREPYGVALNGAQANQPVTVQTGGRLNIGATVAAGESYFLSDTAGAICPEGDLASGEYTSLIGFGVSTTQIDVNIQKSGVAVP